MTRRRGRAGVDRHRADLLVGGPVGVHRVREPPLLADLLEQARRHAAAEDLVEHGEREAVGVVARDRAEPDREVGLLGRAPEHLERPRRRERRARRGPGVDRRRGQRAARPRFDQLDDAVVLEVAGRGDDHVRGVVVLRVVLDDRLARHRGDRLGRPEHRTAERVVGEDRLREQVVEQLVGRVVAHVDLFEDHLALGVHLLGVDGRRPDDVGEDVERELEPVVGDPHVERGVLVARERVHLAADRLDGLGDLERGAGRRALEEQVLEEVTRAGAASSSSRAPVPTQKPTATERSWGSESVTTRNPEPSCVLRMPGSIALTRPAGGRPEG